MIIPSMSSPVSRCHVIVRFTLKLHCFTTEAIDWVCWRYDMPTVQLKEKEELTVQQVAERFGVGIGVVHYWVKHHIIQARRLDERAAYWITLNTEDEQKLCDWVR